MYYLAYFIIGIIISILIEIAVGAEAKPNDAEHILHIRSTREDHIGSYFLGLIIVAIIWLPGLLTVLFRNDKDGKPS